MRPDLTIVSNNAGNGDTGLAALLAAARVRKVICSFPRQTDSYVFDGLYRAGKVALEVVPQGNLAERMRAAGAGIGAFFCPTGVGTPLAEGKELRTIDGRDYVLEYPIRGDVALIGAHVGDRAGNLLYRKTARNFGPVMATAAALTIAEVSHVVDIGEIDPETVVTPGIYVDRIIEVTSMTITAAPLNRPGRTARLAAVIAERHPARARMSTWASASRRWSPTISRPKPEWYCTPRTACSAWARRSQATMSTRPDQRRQDPRHRTAGRVVLPPRRLVRDDARRPPRRVRARRFPGAAGAATWPTGTPARPTPSPPLAARWIWPSAPRAST